MSANPLNSRRNRWIIGGAAGILVIGGSAALATTAFAGDGDNPKTTQVADGDDYSPTSEPAISLGEAATTAADEVSKGILTSIELEGNKDKPLWKVDLITADGTEHELTVNATDGSITRHEKDTDDDTDDWREAKALDAQTKTSPADAAKAAADKVGGGIVTSVELEDDADTAGWDVDVTTDKGDFKSVLVDGASGKATEVYSDDDDDDRHDDDNDRDDDDRDDNDDD